MPIMDYVNELKHQRDLLVNILNEKGITAANDETFNVLIPKVSDIASGGGADNLNVISGQIERFISGAVMSIDSNIPTEISNNATEWIESVQTVENKE